MAICGRRDSSRTIGTEWLYLGLYWHTTEPLTNKGRIDLTCHRYPPSKNLQPDDFLSSRHILHLKKFDPVAHCPVLCCSATVSRLTKGNHLSHRIFFPYWRQKWPQEMPALHKFLKETLQICSQLETWKSFCFRETVNKFHDIFHFLR